MSDINTIKTKLDTDNQKWVISEKEFNDNFGKLDQTDYKKISEWLETKDQQFLSLLQKPIFENLQKKDLLNKQSLSVNEIKTVKLFFMSYGMNANRSGERQKSNDQKMAEMYMNEKWIWYWLWQDWWNEFKKWFKWNMFNLNKSKGKDITYPALPININHPDIKRLNGEWLQVTQQIEKVQRDNYNKIQQNMKDIENKEIATRPLSKKLEELKNKNTLDVLDELTSAPNWILYDDNIKEMTYNEKEKIQKIIEKVFSNPSVNSTQVMDYVWKFHYSLWDEKRSNKTWEKVEWLTIKTNNQVGMRIEIINTCYQLAQAKWFGELQSKPETAKRSLVKLCNILTWRFNSTGKGRMMQEDNDKKFNNPELARGILESLMQINGTIDKISPVDVLKDEPSLKNKECWSFVAEISQNIPRPLSWEFGILDLVSVDEKTKISQLSSTLQARTIVLKKISEKIKSDKKKVPFEPKYIQELKNLWTSEAEKQQTKFESQKKKFQEEIKKAGRYTTSGFEKSAQEYGLQWADVDIFNLYRDFAVNSFWAGQLSDEVDDQIMWYAKMWYMIGWTMLTMMIFPPAWVGYLWSAIAVWVTSTVLTQMLYKKMDYNSFSEWVVDIWSQFVFDTATAFLGMKVFWPIIQKAPWFFNNVKNITSNVWITLFDVSVWAGAEWMRQIWVNELFDKQEKVDILQMIRLWWVMATVFLMVSWWFHVKLPVDDMLRHLKENDPKINPTGFKNLKISEIDYQNSIKLLELKSNALRDVDMQTGGNKRQVLKDQISAWKKIENSGDINIPKWRFEAPVEKKLSPEVEKPYIEIIDDITKWSDGLFNEIQWKLIAGNQKEILVKEYTKKIKDDIDYKALYKGLSSVDKKNLETNIENFCEKLINRVDKFNEYQTWYNKIKKRFNDNNEKYHDDILSLKQIEVDLENGKINKDIYEEYKKILLSGLPKEFQNLKENNPLSDLLITTDERFLFNRYWELELIDIDLVFKWSATIVKFNKINQFEDVYGIYSAGGYSGENWVINIRPDKYDQTWKPIFNEKTLNHELWHAIYNDFGFTSKQVEAIIERTDLISSKKMEDKVDKLDLLDSKSVDKFVTDNIEYSIQNAVDEIIQYTTHDRESAFNVKELLSSDSYNYTKFLDLLIDRYKNSRDLTHQDINKNIIHLNERKDYYNKKIDELCNLAVNAERIWKWNQLIMTPYKEWRKIIQ